MTPIGVIGDKMAARVVKVSPIGVIGDEKWTLIYRILPNGKSSFLIYPKINGLVFELKK